MYAEYIHVSRYLLICANNPTLEGQDHFRNICVCMQNTSMSLGTCSYAQIIQRWKARWWWGFCLRRGGVSSGQISAIFWTESVLEIFFPGLNCIFRPPDKSAYNNLKIIFSSW